MLHNEAVEKLGFPVAFPSSFVLGGYETLLIGRGSYFTFAKQLTL